jgi:hypothetical protein
VLSSHNVGVVGCLWEGKETRLVPLPKRRLGFSSRGTAPLLIIHNPAPGFVAGRGCGKGVGTGAPAFPPPLWLYPRCTLSVVDPHSVLLPRVAALAPQVAMAKSCPRTRCTYACVTAQGTHRVTARVCGRCDG